MSTNTNPESADNEITVRKNRHLEICSGDADIESSEKNLFNEIDFIHNAFPELDSSKVSAGCDFLGKAVSLPVFISCMTGGSIQGHAVNIELARAAEEHRIPVGMGSFRVLLTRPEYFESFNLKKYAPSVPVIGNIGAVQLPNTDSKTILRIAGDLGVDALAIHVNPGQELFQPGGDTDFTKVKMRTAEFIASADLPVIVKETGCGFMDSHIDFFLNSGAAYVDVAGAGGTNWISVERERLDGAEYKAAREFASWGIPTAVSLFNNRGKALLASGGIRTGLDAVKAIALGAECAGMAGPVIRAYSSGGRAGVNELIRQIKTVFKAAMTLTSSPDLASLRKTGLVLSRNFRDIADQYRQAGNEI